LNLNENTLTTVTGLAGCLKLDSLYLKRNRLGRDERGDVESIKGLLERPTLACVDLSDNYLSEPAILEEVLYKMPSLGVLYLQGNPVCRKIDYYRKTIISSIPTLKYLDDRPVFEEDRRRAEAWARGGMDEERLEMKRIKQEKEDKHWANHEAFKIMIGNARKAKKEKEAKQGIVAGEQIEDVEGQASEPATDSSKGSRKETMKDMMARAKAEKEAADWQRRSEQLQGVYKQEGHDREFFDELAEKAQQRYEEKQMGVPHAEQPPSKEEEDALLRE